MCVCLFVCLFVLFVECCLATKSFELSKMGGSDNRVWQLVARGTYSVPQTELSICPSAWAHAVLSG